jgi:hypothetical protein
LASGSTGFAERCACIDNPTPSATSHAVASRDAFASSVAYELRRFERRSTARQARSANINRAVALTSRSDASASIIPPLPPFSLRSGTLLNVATSCAADRRRFERRSTANHARSASHCEAVALTSRSDAQDPTLVEGYNLQ